MPTQCSKHEMKTAWSVVSNTALKSNSTNIVRISFRTFTSAVSMEWYFLKPDWKT